MPRTRMFALASPPEASTQKPGTEPSASATPSGASMRNASLSIVVIA